MNFEYGIHEGTYFTQSGFRSNIGQIQCPYLTNKIQVGQAQDLHILDGAQVYWKENRKFYVSKKNSNKQQMVISASVVGLKHCKYLCEGINIIVTLETMSYQGQTWITARPINKKLPTLLLVDFMNQPLSNYSAFPHPQKMSQFYYWAQIMTWNFGEKYPKACITGLFNRTKTAQSQTEAILYSLEIDQREASLTIQKSLLSSEYLPISTHKKFQQSIFTIDPPDCIDMEDALSLKYLSNSLFEVGIHISDVSSFMNLVDRKEICFRGTSFYLPHKTVQMFPKIITQLCSFQPKKQRLAITVLFKMNLEGEILETNFQKTIVKNSAKMTYSQAQEIIESKSFNVIDFAMRHSLDIDQAESIVQKIKILKSIAFARRKVRKSQDVLDRNEVTFDLNKDNIPIRVGVKKRFDSERLVQEFMIATNGQVAKKLVTDYGPNAMVIHHPKPSEHSINNLNTFFSDFGVRFKSDSIISLETEMKKIFEKQGVKDEFKQALMMRAIQIQQLAVYSRNMNTQKGHYGLNMEYYTHFTSPLRRFADVITHEQLSYCLISSGHKPKFNPSLDQQIQLANKARLKNKKLRQNVVECFLNLFLHDGKQKIKAKAMVMCLGLKSVTLYLPFYNIIKEVPWSCPVVNGGKQSVLITLLKNNKKQQKTIHKNDSIDVQMQSDVHQEIKLTILLKNQNGSIQKL